MAEADSYSSWKSNSLPGTVAAVVLGIGLAFAFAKDLIPAPADLNLAPVALGLAWGWILVQAVDTIRQAIAFNGNPIPVSFQFSNPEQVEFGRARIKGSSRIAKRASSLLSAWKQGLAPQQVVALAQFQGQQNRNAAHAGLAFGLTLLAASAWQGGNGALTVAGLIALSLIYLGRQTVDRQADHYLESRLLCHLPGGTQASGGLSQDDLAAAIGKAMNGGFDQIANSLQAPVENMSRETVAKLENVGRALGSGYEKLEAALVQHAGVMNQAGGVWSQNVQGVLDDHAGKLQEASNAIAEQLSRITQMQGNIEQVLQMQQAIDGALSSVTSAEEFKETFNTLRRHLDDSDQLLREISKPRTIRLVEEDQD